MIRSYFTVALRNLLKRSEYSILNVLGLSIGIACCLLIFQYVSYEKSYDNHPNADQVVRLRLDNYQDGNLEWQSAAVYPAFAPAMKKDFPEIEGYCRLAVTELLLSNDERNVKSREDKGYYADPSVIPMFNISVTNGNSATALNGLNKIMLSASMAEKFFGNENPIGKTLTYRAPFSVQTFEVTGIFIPPVHSHLVINYLISYPTIGTVRRQFGDMSRPEETSWGWYQFYTYLLLKKGTDLKKLENKFPAFCDRYINTLEWKKNNRTRNEVFLISLKDIHLHSHYMQEAEANGNDQAVSFLYLLAMLIVGIAWLNYINLSTGRSMERAKEIGVRKAIGATRGYLIMQFLAESILINLVSLVLALLVALIAAPWFCTLFSDVMPKHFQLNTSYVTMLSIIFVGGVFLSGAYPAIILSRFKPVTVLKGIFKNSPGGLMIRKILIVVQFATSVVLIAGTIIVYRQVTYMRSQPLGININQTLILEGAGSVSDLSYQSNFKPFKEAVLQLPAVKNIAVSTSVMGKENNWSNEVARANASKTKKANLDFLGIDHDFIPAYGMTMVAGRNFSIDFPSDSNAAILNETALRILGFKNADEAINQRLGNDSGRSVIGVVKDYHTEALNKIIEPQLMLLRLNARDVYSVKIESRNVPNTINALRAKWNMFFPNDPFSYYFLDETFDKQYKADTQYGKAFGFFAAVAIIIACFGLIGLSAYNVLQRKKEVGIRKVFGASVQRIAYLLTKDFMKLVLIASVIAVPVAWWLMNKWLQGFAYRISISSWVFVIAGTTTLITALITLSFQTIKAAIANPVNTLRME
ncbi:MAG: ABC transporter permease [Ferruginibacter sp.]|nr:ABC transporter permease [Ferruginibacter sp.]